jgi:hypothetical protein
MSRGVQQGMCTDGWPLNDCIELMHGATEAATTRERPEWTGSLHHFLEICHAHSDAHLARRLIASVAGLTAKQLVFSSPPAKH